MSTLLKKKARKKNCPCDHRFFCRMHSKIKMIICLKNEAKPLHNNVNSLTRYSVFTQENRPTDVIIDKMINRLLIKKPNQGECFEGQYNKVIFYDNQTQNPLRTL